MLCHGHGSSLSEDDSLMCLVIVHLHGTSYPMTDLYYYLYDRLSSSTTMPLLITTVLGSQYFGYWSVNCFIRCLSCYLQDLDHGAPGSRCYTRADVALSVTCATHASPTWTQSEGGN